MSISNNHNDYISWYNRMLEKGFSMSRIAQIVYCSDEEQYKHI